MSSLFSSLKETVSKMDFVTVIIPTFNRFVDLLATLPQVAKFLDVDSELIVFDQSNEYDPAIFIDELENILSGVNAKYIHCKTPSVPLAWNTAVKQSKGDIVLFLDDDINLDENVIEKHRAYYINDPTIVGVAGSYYASSYKRPWVPSGRNGSASTLAGVNVSFRKNIFLKAGAASGFIPPFAPFDWEIAEYISTYFGPLAVGSDIFVFHRAPSQGGCENQAERGVNWYYGCYHNHVLWILHRQFPLNILRIPRHLYWLIKYCRPRRKLLYRPGFWRNSIFKAIKEALKTYNRDGGRRNNIALKEAESFNLVMEVQANP